MPHQFHLLKSGRSILFLLISAIALLAVPAEGDAEPPPVRVIFFGDSLTAGYGLLPDEAYPALIGDSLAAQGYSVEVVNAGVSGDTTAGGARRIAWVLRQPADVLVLALGANDGLRGLEVSRMQANLQNIIDASRATVPNIQIILAGMLAPPNMGAAYTTAFAAAFTDLAEQNNLPLVPFLLEGVAGEATLNQRDGIHPTAEGQQKIARTMLPFVEAAVTAAVESRDQSR